MCHGVDTLSPLLVLVFFIVFQAKLSYMPGTPRPSSCTTRNKNQNKKETISTGSGDGTLGLHKSTPLLGRGPKLWDGMFLYTVSAWADSWERLFNV